MNTTVNVLGIQAEETLQRIGATLKAVMRGGKENRQVQMIEETEKIPCLFTAQGPVFQEERLAEIPPTPWKNNGQILYFKGWFDPGNRESGFRDHGRIEEKQLNRQKIRAKEARIRQSSAVVLFPQETGERRNKQRDVNSSLSPPRKRAERAMLA
ncbi:hypothetical protein [Brevibacillus panacihumi]|uniref:Uncharacterized protein n=1 Tax=Brevibacillus panacihumi TaxID=497735 RepID=A0A3M8C7S7_9BACL|nr:hypothetical protein [Brevibacillus panacihumi]RNB71708.1 hypothetical protein EDM58_22390 [Brevibacillus panacihumi]